MPGNKEKANLKLQIRNTEAEIGMLFEKLDYLTEKLATLEKKPGKNQKQKSQK